MSFSLLVIGEHTTSNMNGNSDAHMPGWQGLTIKEILEKVDLFNIATMSEDEKSEKNDKKNSGNGGESKVHILVFIRRPT